MLLAVFVKNYKIYKQQQFVPISQLHRLSAFVGPNGAGKSSVLEALDTFFNGSQWNVNKVALQNSETTNFINLPHVTPVFAIEKKVWQAAVGAKKSAVDTNTVEVLSEYFWTVQSSAMVGGSKTSPFFEFRDKLSPHFSKENHYLLVSGARYGKDISRPYFGPFHQQRSLLEALSLPPSNKEAQLDRAIDQDNLIAGRVANINEVILEIYDFIYIPADVNIADFTGLEKANMQLLMGRDINEEIRLAIPNSTLEQINQSPEQAIATALSGLDNYTYDKPRGGKKNITLRSLSGLITREFFSIRQLSKTDGGRTVIPVSNLSSGEQRRALIDLTSNYLLKKSELHRNTILAIDEPEISLHTSLCFDQFERLFDVARGGVQTILTTHWYGFLPIAQDGNAHFVNKNDEITIDSYDLTNYRERARSVAVESRGDMPFDIALKSANDLVQSIVSSLRLENPYSWILCEGSSEQIYLSHFLRDQIRKTADSSIASRRGG